MNGQIDDHQRFVMLGDMLVIGRYPAKAIKALAGLAGLLHDTYDKLDGTIAGSSKATCLFTSLAARDFLVAVGFTDATVRPCTTVIRAYDADREVWSVGIGVEGKPDVPEKFNGHCVVVVPGIGLVIDLTLYQAQRPQLRGALPPMLAVPLMPPPATDPLSFTGSEFTDLNSGLRVTVHWRDRPDINWRRQLDATAPLQRDRRRRIAKTLADAFGEWHDDKGIEA